MLKTRATQGREASRLDTFNPHEAYKLRTLCELDSSVPELNRLKGKLSSTISFYLKGHEEEFDIPRLCRALAAPDAIAEEFMEKRHLSLDQKTSNRLSGLHFAILAALNSSLHPRDVIVESKDKEAALLEDILEIRIYLKMYCDIELVRRERELSDKYKFGNPFDPIAQMINGGAAIIRFKYVTDRRTGEEPREKVVSYHPMIHDSKRVLGVHVEGDLKFSMFKLWGNGDETLSPLSSEYKTRIIRWGKDEATAALRGTETDQKFLY
ncbi:MAG: hypothetical protein KGH54_01480 [Candidatus Micrarchaeota archaeon]|nr:hypothetical protein [Candidatus Micrarchaeota archaeon]